MQKAQTLEQASN